MSLSQHNTSVCLKPSCDRKAERRPTDVVLHDLGIVSAEERRGEPSQVELDVPLGGLDVPLVADVHRFPPVGRQRDAHQTWTREQRWSAGLHTHACCPLAPDPQPPNPLTFLLASPLRVVGVPDFSVCLRRREGG